MIFDLQKAGIGKRISAFLFDIILLVTLAVGLVWLIFVIAGYDNYADSYKAIKDEVIAEYEEKYGADLTVGKEDYDKLPEDERDLIDKGREEANKAFASNKDAAYNYTMMINIMLTALSLGALIAYMLLEFVVPLLFRNGQTLGKKIFGIAVMMTNGVKISPVALFVRTVLGKYTVETMVPAYILILLLLGKLGIVGLLVLVLLLVFEAGLLIFNKTRPMIHDALAMTVTVDFASQMIFDSEEAFIEYKKKAHQQEVEKTDY